ncbi:MAG TPA: hypothetical protein VGQ65_00305 [Thermoanaerobaculia bacterium]|jgi:hypothetical protein|nr:hypothetical protein [Thermoanaerobaculia bacterium]
MSNTVNTPGTSIPDTVSLNADAVIAQLRTMRSQIEDVAPLSKGQRKLIQQRLRFQPKNVVEAAINVIGVLDNVSQAIGQPLDDVRQLQDDSLRWDAAAEEARAFVKGIEGANLNRRQRLALIATQAYAIGSQLAKDPAKAVLLPHVEEVKRLKGVSRRKKAAKGPQTPVPTSPPPPVPGHLTSTTPTA